MFPPGVNVPDPVHVYTVKDPTVDVENVPVAEFTAEAAVVENVNVADGPFPPELRPYIVIVYDVEAAKPVIVIGELVLVAVKLPGLVDAE